MQEQKYLTTVYNVLANDGQHKPNRTAVDTISSFSQQYEIDVSESYPLLTTKKMDGYRWNSLLHEMEWYLSGEEHIQNLREETKIWDAWADDNGHLDTAYGRFWRRYPMPAEPGQLDGETWAAETHGRWKDNENIDPDRWLNKETHEFGAPKTFDQLQYVIDMLNENPNSRRLVVNAWHPANAAVSTLPPCHFTFVFNVQGDELNVHLTQRSADLALGVPFNIACYALLLKIIAQQTGFKPGTFSHTLVDAHVYCGNGARGEWYADNIDELQERMQAIDPSSADREEFREIKQWVESETPPEPDDMKSKDHVPGLLEQLAREPRDPPKINIADKSIDDITAGDFELEGYDSYDGITFGVAE